MDVEPTMMAEMDSKALPALNTTMTPRANYKLLSIVRLGQQSA